MVQEMLLLGAGASVEAGIACSVPLTEQIIRYTNEQYFGQYVDALYFVYGGLLFQKGVQGKNPGDGVNVEELFSAIQILADRDNLEVVPFVGQWHPRVTELEASTIDPLIQILDTVGEVKFPNESFLTNSIVGMIESTIIAAQNGGQPTVSTSQHNANLAEAIKKEFRQYAHALGQALRATKTKEYASKLPSALQRQNYFDSVAQVLLRSLRYMVWLTDSRRSAYLAPILNLLSRQEKLVVATLNYDNTVELMCDSHEVPCHTGILDWGRTGSFDVMPKNVTLLKLHGSMNWMMHKDPSGGKLSGPWLVREATQFDEHVGERPALVFGQRNKLTANGPFLSILSCFVEALKFSEQLTTVGYSFSDEHINVQISRWLNSSSSKKLRAIGGKKFDESAYLKELLSIYGSRIEIVKEFAGESLERIYGVYPQATKSPQRYCP